MASEAEFTPTSNHVDAAALRTVEFENAAASVDIVDDAYSDRIRCDHPDVRDAEEFGRFLKEKAAELGRDRVVTLVDPETGKTLEKQGFLNEGEMPGFYRGETDCTVMGWSHDDSRMTLASPARAARTDAILAKKRDETKLHVATATESATLEDAAELADLLGRTFDEYPTPSSDPAYLAKELEQGTPFRVIRENGEIAACASADLVTDARTAELTDCATRAQSRGNGYMQSILRDLMRDLRERDYPTAFTLARAGVPGVNIAFQRLGFEFRGRMPQSCRIGEGLEDMNIWSRWL
jgi:putative beta-lysine N-acetyltransferase